MVEFLEERDLGTGPTVFSCLLANVQIEGVASELATWQ
tara:strand:+ start:597 stop:710 length:114 start_codon:yes stop_codon:yes gene_type:complete